VIPDTCSVDADTWSHQPASIRRRSSPFASRTRPCTGLFVYTIFAVDMTLDRARGGRPAYSVALPPSKDVVEYARLAARLGYERVWLFDSPAMYGDVWVAVARVAEAAPDICVATGVAVTSLRHPMVTASAIATIEELAPGRLWAYFGTGFTARFAMGKRGVRWAELATYVGQVRGLLRGEVVEIDNEACQMLHVPGFGPARPIAVPLGMAPIGPKGFAVARELADGVILTSPAGNEDRHWQQAALLTNGSVLDPGEDYRSPRLLNAAGPAYVTGFHALASWSQELVQGAPGGAEWLGRIEAERPERELHLAVHEGHLVTITERDRPLLAAAGEQILETGWTGYAASIAARMTAVGAAGITEVVYGPAGPDIPRELEAFAAAARSPTGAGDDL
jgi:5,10-methylenetetrahydromethanopterin reductase